MLIEDRFYDQEWVQELNNEDFRMLHYLLHFASKKTGIVELNMRQLNFSANTGTNYTVEDIVARFSNMIKMLPGRKSTAIFYNYIATNWMKNGNGVDVSRNPLFKSIVQELASFGLTIEDVNNMATKKIVVLRDIQKEEVRKKDECAGDEDELDEMFSTFWKEYPGPRKIEKQKCKTKLFSFLRQKNDRKALFANIMEGLEKWKNCSMWNKDGGKFIMNPHRWLNNKNWESIPTDKEAYESRTANANVLANTDSLW